MRSSLPPGRRFRLGILPILASLPLLLSGRAAGDDATDDGVPAGTVAFFLMGGKSCPQGWSASAAATGRLVAGVTDGTDVEVQVGTPLGEQEDRKHQHPYSVQATLPYKSVAAADGGNRDGAQAGALTWKEQTAPAPSALPFIQLLVCEKQ